MVTTDDGRCFLSLNSSPGQIPRARFRFTESARSSLARYRRNCDIGETLIGDEVEPCLRRCWQFSHRPVTSRKQHAKHSAVALGCPFVRGLQKSCTEALSRSHPRPRMIPPPSNLRRCVLSEEQQYLGSAAARRGIHGLSQCDLGACGAAAQC